MIRIPILRHGRPYTSVEEIEIVHHATGEPLARISQANSGLVARDIHRMDADALRRFKATELFALCRRAGELFMTARLPLGDDQQSFEDYLCSLSATTGSPIVLCRANASKIHKVMTEMDQVVAGLMRHLDPAILDHGYARIGHSIVSYARQARVFGAVLPSNSPGVHSLWVPALALKTPIALKPGREEPWTPYRIIQSFIAAGAPREAFGYYPTDHAGAGELLRHVDRAMLFGDASTTRAWANNPRVQLHGPGFSKVILGPDAAGQWQKYVDVIVSSIKANGGRSCLNASAVWTPKHGRELAEAIATQLAKVQARPADDPQAELAAFANPVVAESISATIDRDLAEPGAHDLTEPKRGTSRLVRLGRCAYLLPTVVWCDSLDHPLANREFLFPYASVVECPIHEIPHRIGPTLVGTVITEDAPFIRQVMDSENIDRLNIGPIPTWRISWDQPHEGNLFDFLYRQRAFQVEPAA